MLTWISEQAKWVIYIFGVFIVIGLLFMGMSQMRTHNVPGVAVVNGTEISADAFRNRLKQIQVQRRQQGLPPLSDTEFEEQRNQLLEDWIQQVLLKAQYSKNGIRASVAEMQADLRNDPPPGVKNSPMFMTDSVFDQKKYDRWLATDSIYDMPEVRQLEGYLQNEKIPYKQLQNLLGAAYHQSDLEAAFDLTRRETRFQADFFLAPADSFTADSITEKDVQAYYESQPDSFKVENLMRRFKYLKLNIRPSAYDDKNTRDYSLVIRNQITSGAKFADVARNVSDDLGSAKNGGSLGDYTNGNNWVPSFKHAALALDSGELSQPVKTRYGYHLLHCDGKKIENGDTLVKISHILLKLTPGTETVDSLERILEGVRTQILAGKSLDDAAKEAKLPVKLSTYVERGKVLPEMGHLSGLTSYGFGTRPNEDPVSRVLQNRKVVCLLQKADSLQAGDRSIELVRSQIQKSLTERSKVRKAAEFLKSKMAELKALTELNQSVLEPYSPIRYDTTRMIGLDSYFEGLGFANSKIWKVATQKDGQWGTVLQGDRGAVMARVLKRELPDTTGIAQRIAQERMNSTRFAAPTVFNDFMKKIKKDASIQNNMDLHF